MLKIYLVRHGQDEDNANGILNGRRNQTLTEKGRLQAQQLAQEMKTTGLIFDAIYSSPLSRAYATAETVTNTLGLQKPIVMEDLIERDFGIMTGKPVKDIEELCSPDVIKGDPVIYFLSPKGAETFPALIERGKRVIDKIEAQYSDGNILLVCHGDIGKMIYAAYYHLDWKQVLTLFHFGNSDLLILSSDSLPQKAHKFKFEQYNH